MKFLCLFLLVLSFVGLSFAQTPTFISTSPDNIAIPQAGQVVPTKQIVITGSNFRNGMIVNFNGAWYPLTVLSKTQAYWMFPQRAFPSVGGYYTITLQNTHGSLSNPLTFLFCDPLPLTTPATELPTATAGSSYAITLTLPTGYVSGCHL